MCSKAHVCMYVCIGENCEIYKSFSVPIKREVIKTDKDNKKALKLYPTK